jgi:hypothetical protein
MSLEPQTESERKGWWGGAQLTEGNFAEGENRERKREREAFDDLRGQDEALREDLLRVAEDLDDQVRSHCYEKSYSGTSLIRN